MATETIDKLTLICETCNSIVDHPNSPEHDKSFALHIQAWADDCKPSLGALHEILTNGALAPPSAISTSRMPTSTESATFVTNVRMTLITTSMPTAYAAMRITVPPWLIPSSSISTQTWSETRAPTVLPH